MKAILPFEVKYTPITKLALINFEKKPDQIYSGLEFQYVEGDPLGTGYRLIAYRNDKYVDVYDEKTIKFNPDEKFDVAQKGLKHHVQREFENTCFQSVDENVHISFTLLDCDNRKIEVEILEHTKKKSIPMNLLAPIGYGSEKPSCLPLFFLYGFDFVRRGKTDIKLIIDGVKLKLDPFPFPVPMNMQWRYYTRFTLDSQIVEFLNTENRQVKIVELDGANKHTDGIVEYQFKEQAGEMALSEVHINKVNHPFKVAFELPISLKAHNGEFQILPEKHMGNMNGSYQVAEDEGKIRIEIVPDKGWRPVPNSRITKMILGDKSIFCNWSKKYRYEQVINKNDLSTEAKWINENTESN